MENINLNLHWSNLESALSFSLKTQMEFYAAALPEKTFDVKDF